MNHNTIGDSAIQSLKTDPDWMSVFDLSSRKIHVTEGSNSWVTNDTYSIKDVAYVISYENGENDGLSWIMVARLSDRRFVFIEAWCDYTGWDCQSGGWSCVSDDIDSLIQFGLTEPARERLKLEI